MLTFSFFTRGDVVYFDGLIETILAVGLVKPKAGMSCSLSTLVFVVIAPIMFFALLSSFSRRDFATTHSLPLGSSHFCWRCDSWAKLSQEPGQWVLLHLIFPQISAKRSCIETYMLMLLFFCCRSEWQHVRWDAAAPGPSLLHPHGQHLHSVHQLHRLGPNLYGRQGRLPVWDSLPGWGRVAEPALQKDQPLQKLAVLPHPLGAPVLLLGRWYSRVKPEPMSGEQI